MGQSWFCLAYFAPDTVLPVASALASLVGAILWGWSYILRAIRSAATWLVASLKDAKRDGLTN